MERRSRVGGDNWPRLKQGPKTGRSILFFDETSLVLEPLVRRTQVPRGQQPVMDY